MSAFTEGFEAYNSDRDVTENPYNRDTENDDYEQWESGFWAGHEADEET